MNCNVLSSRCVVRKQPPQLWYQTPRDADNRLCKNQLMQISIFIQGDAKERCDREMLDILDKDITAEAVGNVLLRLLEACVLVTFDGRRVMVADSSGVQVPYPMLDVSVNPGCVEQWLSHRSAHTLPLADEVTFDLGRMLPISRHLDGCSLRVVFLFAGDMVITNDFWVKTKEPETKTTPQVMVPALDMGAEDDEGVDDDATGSMHDD